MADQLLMARLAYGSDAMAIDGPSTTSVAHQTSFEYLTGCWRRLQSTKVALSRRGYNADDVAQGMTVIERLHSLIVSYAGLSVQDPSMFYQPPA